MPLQAFFAFTSSKLIPLIFSIVGFGLLIVIHELGHFLFAKAFNIHTPTFSVGFGPALIEKKIGDTTFRIAKIPFGGYVEIAGLAEPGQGDQKHSGDKSDRSFNSKPFWQKFLVLTGGIIFNLIFAYVTFSILFMVGDNVKKPVVIISHIQKGSAAEKFGLKPGDLVQKFNDTDVAKQSSLEQAHKALLKTIQENPEQEINLQVLRNNETIELDITLGTKKLGDKTIGLLGAGLSIPMQRLPFFQAIKKGFTYTNEWIVRIATSMKNIFTKRSLEGAGGPIQILALGFKTAQSGFIPLFIFLAIMSINLALFNLLPLGVTDGGKLLTTTIEAIIRREIPESIQMGINIVSLALFLFLFAYLTYNDIVTLFGKTISGLFGKLFG